MSFYRPTGPDLRLCAVRRPKYVVPLLWLICAAALAYGQVSVLTHHNDNARTGQNLNEVLLGPSNVNQAQFGKLYTFPVDGWIISQPLYLQNVSIPNLGSHNVLYVTTLHDSIYALDADSNVTNGGSPLWQVSFINPALGITTVNAVTAGCNNVTQFTEQGIISTPVIDPIAGTLYVVAKTAENGSYFQRLHALDVATGQERPGSPVVIAATYPGTGDGSTTVTFNALNQMSRAALLLVNQTLYVSFAANGCKQVHNYGWELAYDATTLQQVGVFNTTPNANNGGIWQSGSGPAADSSGNIYFETADAVFDVNTGGPDFGDSILKLNLGVNGLSLADYFTPMNQATYNSKDQDLGSVGPIVLPDQPGPYPHLLIGSGKDETLYLINRDNMGGYNTLQDQIVQEIPPLYTRLRGQVPTYWNGMVYFQQFLSPVVAYSLSNGLLSSMPVSQTSTSYTRNNTSSISANGTSNAILWLVTAATSGSGTLRAYDATNLATEFYDSDQSGTRDTLGTTAHFIPPTVANGRVYIGTQTELAVFGLLNATATATPSPSSLNFGTVPLGTTSASQTLTITNSGNIPLSVSSVSSSGDFAAVSACSTYIPAGSTCTIAVTFTPTASGTRNGTVSVVDNATGSPQTIPVSGTGGTPMANLIPGTLNFPNQMVGTSSVAQVVTLSNSGLTPLNITNIVIGADFGQTNNCGGVVAAGSNCSFNVVFSPTAVGGLSESLTIFDNDPSGQQSAVLTGTGTYQLVPAVALSPASLTFNNQLVGTTSASSTILLTNTGTGVLNLAAIAASGDFALLTTGSSCPYSGGPITPASNCTIDVTFSPTQAGMRSGTVSVTDNAPGSPQAVTLSGLGVPSYNPVPWVSVLSVPDATSPGSGPMAITVNGAGFVAGSTVNWNQSPRPTTFVSASQLTANVTASDVANAGTAAITVTTAGPGGGTSNAVSFEVTGPYTPLNLARTDSQAGSSPSAFASSDLNGDGLPDLIVASNVAAGGVNILLSNPDHSLGGAAFAAGGAYPAAIAVADVNHDGRQDVILANAGDPLTSTPGSLSVLLGNGDGTFQTAMSFAAGTQPGAVVAGDFNQDGVLDLAVTDVANNAVSILPGNGDGTFQSGTAYTVGAQPSSVAAGDFNGDGKLDLAVANEGDSTISILLGNGDGTFAPAVAYVSGGPATAVAVGDFNGDGKLDLAVANGSASNFSVLLGNGDGTFQAHADYPAGSAVAGLTVADMDGDGKLDIAIVSANTNNVSTFEANADGTFQSAVAFGTGNAPQSIVAVDWDNNGRMDLVTTNSLDGTVSLLLQAPVAQLSSGGINFGNQQVGVASGQQPITITNQGSASLNVTNLAITGANAADFAVSGVCPAIAPGGNCTVNITFTPTASGQRSATLQVTDNANGSPQSVALQGTGTTTATSTVLSSSVNPSVYGQPVTLTALVTGPSGTPTGSVSFFDGANLIGSANLTNGSASLVVSSLAVGAHSLSAGYGGDNSFSASTSASVPQTVGIASSSVTISGGAAVSYGQVASFTATITPQFGGTATGMVTFSDGVNVLGTVGVSNNVASLTTASLAVGTHNISASYSGDANYAGSNSGAVSQIVNTATTTTTLSSSVNPCLTNQLVVFTSTVTGQYGAPLGGSVSFKVGATLIGTVNLVNGQASLTTSFTSAGTRTVTASYAGDSNDQKSNSPTFSQGVNKSTTTTVVTSSANPSSAGQNVTFTATVTAAYGVINNGDTVTFKDGTTVLGTATTSNGVANFSTSALTIASHQIKALYSGDVTFAGSTSAVFTQTVNKYVTATALTSSLNPSTFGQTILLTATITSTGPAPTGTVTFKNGTAIIGTVAVSGGSAVLSTATVPAGTRSMTATYNGDRNNATSTSPVLSQVINRAKTTETLTSSLNPSTSGQAVTFTATITSQYQGAVTGTVSFLDGLVTLSKVQISGGKASVTTSTLAKGSHQIKATYNPDANNLGSSVTLTQQVN